MCRLYNSINIFWVGLKVVFGGYYSHDQQFPVEYTFTLKYNPFNTFQFDWNLLLRTNIHSRKGVFLKKCAKSLDLINMLWRLPMS